MPESKKSPESVVTKRFKELLKSCFNNNLKELERACEKVAGEEAPSYGALRKHQSGSMPGLDQAAIIARAAGVSLEWLAGMKKPDPLDESRAGRRSASTTFDKIERLVHEEGGPPIKTEEFAGWTVLVAGREQLTFDIIVRGRSDRAIAAEVRQKDAG